MNMSRAFLLLATVLSVSTPARAAGDDLLRVEHCYGSRTTEARAECEKRRRDLENAYRKEQQQKKLDEARARKNSTLCFTRKATQETVCPN